MDEKNENATATVQPRNIFQRMAAATEEINRVAKNLTVGVGRSAYKATGEADVLAAVKPAEARNGIYSYPIEREIIETDTLVSVDWEGKEKKQLFMRLRVVYRFVNVDNPGEYIDITSFGDGIDSGDKGTGKAMTYADKYALLKAYKIETGDDPDQHASDDLKSLKLKSATPEQVAFLESVYTGESLAKLLTANSVGSLSELPAAKAKALIDAINAKRARAQVGTEKRTIVTNANGSTVTRVAGNDYCNHGERRTENEAVHCR